MLLKLCMKNVGKVIPRERMLKHVYDWDDDIQSNAIEVHIHSLRKKFGYNIINTHRNIGYLFSGDISSYFDERSALKNKKKLAIVA